MQSDFTARSPIAPNVRDNLAEITLMKTVPHPKRILAGLAMLLASLNAPAQPVSHFTVILSGAAEIPPNVSAFGGSGVLSLAGNMLDYSISLSLARWLGAIHGPARPGTNAPVVIDLGHGGCALPFPPFPGGCAFIGSVTVSNEQISNLLAGVLYFRAVLENDTNIAIRGQITMDNDQDGVPDDRDQCPNTPAGAQVDSHGCSLEQLCPCGGPWRHHGEHVRCVRDTTTAFVKDGLITPAEARAIVKHAVRSNCGRPGP